MTHNFPVLLVFECARQLKLKWTDVTSIDLNMPRVAEEFEVFVLIILTSGISPAYFINARRLEFCRA
jgi:hypothetical protein